LEQLQNQARQATNAMNLLVTHKNILPEVRVDAEKVLLVSTEKYDHLKGISESARNPKLNCSKGQVVISDISLIANQIFLDEGTG
jgi:hypothetical protein